MSAHLIILIEIKSQKVIGWDVWSAPHSDVLAEVPR